MEPKEPTREEQLVSAVHAHYEALTDLVNEDALNLVAAVGMLHSQLRHGGHADEKDAVDPDFDTQVKNWVLTRARVQVALLMAVTVWSALEAFVEDVWIEMCTVSEISEEHPLGKEKISLSEMSALTERERYRKIWNRLHPEQGVGIGRYDELLEYVGLRAAVSDVPVRAETKTRQDGGDIDDAWTRRALGELKEVRNVVLHRRGVADLRLQRVSGERSRQEALSSLRYRRCSTTARPFTHTRQRSGTAHFRHSLLRSMRASGRSLMLKAHQIDP